MTYHPRFASHVVEAIRVAGLGALVRVDYVTGWATRGGASFTPEGVGQHHTAVSLKTTWEAARRLIVEGRPDVPGPLANAHLSRKVKESGGRYVLSIIAAGRANHGGTGVWKGISGNSRWFGLETDNNGIGEPWPGEQLRICAAFAAGCLHYLGKDASWQWEHKEYATPPGRKPDRASVVPAAQRAMTAEILTKLRVAPPPIAPPPPPPAPIEELAMSMKDNALIAAKVQDPTDATGKARHGYIIFVTEPDGRLVGHHTKTWPQHAHLARLLEVPAEDVGSDWIGLVTFLDGPLAPRVPTLPGPTP